MSSLWERALGWLSRLIGAKEACRICGGTGRDSFQQGGRWIYIPAPGAICEACEGSGAVERSGASEEVAGGSGRGVPGVEPGADEGAKKAPLTNAQKQRRYRERKKLSDPDYLSREAQRQRERRSGVDRS